MCLGFWHKFTLISKRFGGTPFLLLSDLLLVYSLTHTYYIYAGISKSFTYMLIFFSAFPHHFFSKQKSFKHASRSFERERYYEIYLSKLVVQIEYKNIPLQVRLCDIPAYIYKYKIYNHMRIHFTQKLQIWQGYLKKKVFNLLTYNTWKMLFI